MVVGEDGESNAQHRKGEAMIHIKAGKNVDICVEDGRVVGLNVKTADGRVFVHLPQPETFLEVFSKTIKECEEKP